MVKASGIGFDLEDEQQDERLALAALLEGLDGALPDDAPVTSVRAGAARAARELGADDSIAAPDAVLHFYDRRMAELDASCDDDLGAGSDARPDPSCRP